jgi:hypothetical protein
MATFQLLPIVSALPLHQPKGFLLSGYEMLTNSAKSFRFGKDGQ